MALWLVYSEGRHLAWAQTGCLQEGRLAQSVVADGRQCRSAKGTWMVQGRGRFVWNHKVTAHGWIIRKWVFLVKALSAVCPRLSAALRATLLLVRGCPRHGVFLSYFVVRGCPRMDIERKIASILRPCCPRPPGSPTSCGKAVVRGRYGFLLGFDFFWCVNRLQRVHFLRGLVWAALLVFVCYRGVPIQPWLTPNQ